jgi:hypothetical protein
MWNGVALVKQTMKMKMCATTTRMRMKMRKIETFRIQLVSASNVLDFVARL